MILQLPRFQLISSPILVNFGQNERFSEKLIYFWKNKHLITSPQYLLKQQVGCVATNQMKKNQKSYRFNLWHFFRFSKKTKISNLLRDKVPEFQKLKTWNLQCMVVKGWKLSYLEEGVTKKLKKKVIQLRWKYRDKMTPLRSLGLNSVLFK